MRVGSLVEWRDNGEIEEGQIAWVQISYSEDINASLNTPINYEKNATVSISTKSGSSEEMLHIWNGIYIGSKIKGIICRPSHTKTTIIYHSNTILNTCTIFR